MGFVKNVLNQDERKIYFYFSTRSFLLWTVELVLVVCFKIS